MNPSHPRPHPATPTSYPSDPNRERGGDQLGRDPTSMFGLRQEVPLLFARRPEDADALAEASGRRLGVERANAVAGFILAAGCLLTLLFVLLTG